MTDSPSFRVILRQQYCKEFDVVGSVMALLEEVPSGQLAKYGLHNLLSAVEGRDPLTYDRIAVAKLMIFVARFHANVVVVNTLPVAGEEPLNFNLDECSVLKDALTELDSVFGGATGGQNNAKETQLQEHYASMEAASFLKETKADLDFLRRTCFKGIQRARMLEHKLATYLNARADTRCENDIVNKSIDPLKNRLNEVERQLKLMNTKTVTDGIEL